MVQETPYRPEPDDLNRVSSDEAVDILRALLLKEAWASGIAKGTVDVPSEINVKDGGIDAEVTDSPVESPSGLIRPGLTRYQIKSSTGTSGKDAIVNEILFKNGTLHPRVKSCLDKGGTLVAVLFEDDIPDTEDDELRKKFIARLKETNEKYESANIEIFRQNKLITVIERYPSLALRVRGIQPDFQTHESWSEDGLMRKTLVESEEQRKKIESIREEILERERAVHIRITGEAGAGKTRLALESTHHPLIRPSVCYFDGGERFVDSPLFSALLMEDNDFDVTLVVDECRPEDAAKIWNKLKNRGKRIALITIHNETEVGYGTTQPVESPPLDDDELAEIIASYGTDEFEAKRWAPYCGGSPRVAHVIGNNLVRYPDDLLGAPDTVKVWKRFIACGDDPESPEVKDRARILRHLALFRRFGHTSADKEERDAILTLLQDADPDITPTKLDEVIKKLREHKVLQGTSILYISPKALHIRLWVEWWEYHGDSDRFLEIAQTLPPSLLDSAFEMLRYADESDLARETVRQLLADNGPFQSLESLESKLGGRLFRYLTEADPKASLKCVKRLLGNATEEELRGLRQGRRDVIPALRMIAMERHLFGDAARLLLALGEAENERWSNNASGVFASLFSLARHPKVSPTAAPPDERIHVLEDAFASDSRERHRLAIRACEVALEVSHHVRDVGPERRGIRPEVLGWSPDDREEWVDAYRQIWTLLREQVGRLPPEEASKASKILSQKARQVARFPELRDQVYSTLEELSESKTVDEEALVRGLTSIIRYEQETLSDQDLQRYDELRQRITEKDFSSKLKRYVGMSLIEDHVDDEGNHTDTVTPNIKALAKNAMESPETFKNELPWLVTSEAKNGRLFGYHLGLSDSERELWQPIVKEQLETGPEGNPALIAGYLKAIYEADPTEWQDRVLQLKEHDVLVPLLPTIAGASGMTPTVGRLMANLVEDDRAPPSSLRIFTWDELSEDVFAEWIETLLARDDPESAVTALNIVHTYYDEQAPRGEAPEQLLWRVLTNPVLAAEREDGVFSQMGVFYWKDVADRFIEQYPDRQLDLADWMLEHMGTRGAIVSRFYSEVHEVLNKVAQANPSETWQTVVNHLETTQDKQAYMIGHWLRDAELEDGKKGAIRLFPVEDVLSWIDTDPEERAPYIAYSTPLGSLVNEDEFPLAREVLARFGDVEDVHDTLFANLTSGSTWGKLSDHYRGICSALREVSDAEDDPNVLRWIDDTLDELEDQIDQWIRWEERNLV